MNEKKEDETKKGEESPKSEKPKAEDVKIFKAKSMTDGDLRMPKALREKIKWLNAHTDVVFEILEQSETIITLRISRAT